MLDATLYFYIEENVNLKETLFILYSALPSTTYALNAVLYKRTLIVNKQSFI